MESSNKIALDMRELREINSGREVFYNFLSRSYKMGLKEEYLEMLETLMPYIEKIASQSKIGQLEKGGKLLGEFVSNLKSIDSEKKDELIHKLARDYTYIFTTAQATVPTSESVYLAPTHLVKQEPRNQVLKIYRKIGFKIPEDFKRLPEDHIVLELEFMATLSHLIGKSIDNKDKESILNYLNCQKEFIKEHLNKWIPKFCDFLIRTAEERVFYKGLAYLTEGFLISDHEILKEMFLGVE